MMKPVQWALRIAALLLTIPVMTGCWDRRELNDQAIITAWGMDLNKDGTYRGTAQFAIPGKMGSGEKSDQGKAFFTASGNGKNVYEASKDMRLKLSRPWFEGHRGVVLIGEALAKHGLDHILDELSRDTTVRLRTDMFVLKGGSVQEFLEMPYPLERLSSKALVKMHETAGLNSDLTLLDFLMAASGEESCPVLPVISKSDASFEENSKRSDPKMKLWGFAIFDTHARLVSYLPMNESYIQKWIKEKLSAIYLTVQIPGEKGSVAVEATDLQKKVKTSVHNGKVHIQLTLSGISSVRENNTNLDLSESANIMLVQNELNNQTNQFVRKVIQKIQALGTDVLGFGEALHRQHPYAWKTIKKDWMRKFSEADVSTDVELEIRDAGITGPSAILKKNEIRR